MFLNASLISDCTLEFVVAQVYQRSIFKKRHFSKKKSKKHKTVWVYRFSL